MDSIRQNDIKFEKSGQVWVRTPDTVRTARKAAKSGETRAPCQEIWIQKIVAMGCRLIRHGGKHDWYQNPNTGMAQPVPRHREIREFVARSILKKLS